MLKKVIAGLSVVVVLILCGLLLWDRSPERGKAAGLAAQSSSGRRSQSENAGADGAGKNKPREDENARGQDSSRERTTRHSGIIRPQDRGKDVSGYGTDRLVNLLAESEDKIERRKVARELGNRNINGTLDLNGRQRRKIHAVVTEYLHQSTAEDANRRAEAKQQIERLWRTAVPTLLQNMTHSDATIAELAMKSLILMRNEEIIQKIIQKGREATGRRSQQLIRFTLKKMKERRKSLIPGRKCLNRERSSELHEKHVRPVLDRMKKE